MLYHNINTPIIGSVSLVYGLLSGLLFSIIANSLIKRTSAYMYFTPKKITGCEIVQTEDVDSIQIYSFKMNNILNLFSIGKNIAYYNHLKNSKQNISESIELVTKNSYKELEKEKEIKELKRNKYKIKTINRINNNGDLVDFELKDKIEKLF